MVDNPEIATNGGDAASLPASYRQAVEYGLTKSMEVAAQRDALLEEVSALKLEIAQYKVVTEAQKSQLLEIESRMQSNTLVRDQAVAERAKYEALFVSVLAQLRAFIVPAVPLIKEVQEEMDAQQEEP